MDLSNVPFFQRPMSAKSSDKPTGNMDEAGNREYMTVTGQTYFVKPAEDQRTIRTKVEEDVIPAAKEYLKDPKLPSAEQMKQFGVDVAKGTYESVDSAVKGTGTMGDAFGVAPVMAAVSSAFDVPVDSLRIFGGKRAEDPGYTRSGSKAPKSIGRDGKERFEVDDSEAVFIPENLSKINSNSKVDTEGLTRLSDAFIHEELFYQYPELRDITVVVDEGLSGSRTRGYYTPSKNLIALSPETAADKQGAINTVLHELQHSVQNTEGFSQGTNIMSREVFPVAEGIRAEGLAQQKKYDEALNTMVTPELESDLKVKLADFYAELLEEKGLNIPELISKPIKDIPKSVSTSSEVWDYAWNLRRLMEDADRREAPDLYTGKGGKGVRSRLSSLRYEVNEAVKIATKTGKTELLEEVLGTDIPKGLSDRAIRGGEFKSGILEKALGLPVAPKKSFDPLFEAYKTKAGEVEAENVVKRKGLSLEERFDTPPESTEHTPRDKQWTGDVPRYNKGGLVPMDEQMKAFSDEGGLTDDGQTVDPVSGNEIPPGSMAEEVRDDVDAKLSDGEYVIPADVVRFFGVSYFEKLRKKAKEGLAEMEEDGRIGGEPIPESPQDDLPFSDEELMSMEDEAPVGMAEGGVVNSGFDASNFQPGFSEQAGGGIETKTYINAAGDQKSIMFINGSPIQQIPAGYMEATPENRAQLARDTEAQNMSESPTSVDFDGGMTGSPAEEGFASEAPDYSSMSAEELGQAAENMDAVTAMGTAASLMGVPFGGVLAEMNNSQTAKGINARSAELGVESPVGKDGKEAPKGFIGNVTEAISNVFSGGNTGGISTAPGNYQGPTESGKAGYSVGPAASDSGSGGASGDDSGDDGEAGYGGGFGGYANKGMLVNKKVRQKVEKPKPEGKGLVKRKPKKK